ncbi:MAG: amidase family protein [Pseudorhodoplanes sp.]|nr:amidase family protein [Pseudorhodoplanes sp.]
MVRGRTRRVRQSRLRAAARARRSGAGSQSRHSRRRLRARRRRRGGADASGARRDGRRAADTAARDHRPRRARRLARNLPILQGREVWSLYGDFITTHKPQLDKPIRRRFEAAAGITADEAAQADEARTRARRRIESLAQPGTVLVLPTSPAIAPRRDASGADTNVFRTRIMELTCISGLSGLPQVTIPAGTVDGCPAGLSFIGWRDGDEALLGLAGALSRHCGIEG